MPFPEGRNLTQGASYVLTNLAMNYLGQLEQRFIARDVFPLLPVGRRSGLYNIMPREDFLRPEAKALANYEASPIGGFKFDQASYITNKYGIASIYTDQEMAEAESGGIGAANLIRSKVRYVAIQLLLRLEIDTANLVRNSANWTFSQTGVASGEDGTTTFRQWNDPASDPIAFFKDLLLTLDEAAGFTPNRMIMPPRVSRQLTEHPDFIDRVKYGGTNGQPAQVNMQAVADLLGFEGKILVPRGQVNSGAEGQAANLSNVWGKDIWVGHVSDAPSVDEPSAGYHISWTGMNGVSPSEMQGIANEEGLFIRRYFENRPAAYFVDGQYFTVPKVTAPSLGFLLKNAVA